jgi:hypothetical protein
MMKLLALNFCLLLCLVSCAKKAGESGQKIIQPQTSETDGGATGGADGGTTGGTDGGTTGGTDGGTTGGTDGGTTGGTDGGTTGGTDGGTTGGSDGGTTGGSDPYVTLYFGNSSDAHSGVDTTGFSSDVNLSNATAVDFNEFKKGKYSKLGTFAQNKFEFTVGAEKLKSTDPVDTLENAFGTTTYKFKIENPVSQNGKKGIESGIETKSGLFAPIKKITAIWKFDRPISFWGASLIDVESSTQAYAKLRLFDCESNILEDIPVIYPDKENGNKQIHFVGFVSSEANVCAVSLTVGDFSFLGGLAQGLFRAIAIDDFVFGE